MTLSSSVSTPTVSLHVGCGKNPRDGGWLKDLYTPNRKISHGTILNALCKSSGANATVSCAYPPRGTESDSGNLGIAGYCTYGAYIKWKQATGYYPKIGGNAIEMPGKAKDYGFRLSTVPHPRALVVFDTGDKYGHVGWVTDVDVTADGKVTFDFWDMNGWDTGSYWIDKDAAKTNLFNTFDHDTGRTWDPSRQTFILAPPP